MNLRSFISYVMYVGYKILRSHIPEEFFLALATGIVKVEHWWSAVFKTNRRSWRPTIGLVKIDPGQLKIIDLSLKRWICDVLYGGTFQNLFEALEISQSEKKD